MNTSDVSRGKFGITSISRNFLDIPEFPRLLGKFPKSQVDSRIPKILGQFPSSGSAGTERQFWVFPISYTAHTIFYTVHCIQHLAFWIFAQWALMVVTGLNVKMWLKDTSTNY